MSENAYHLNPIPKDSEIVKAFDTSKWLCWINDILNYDTAYPFSRLTVDGDVIVDLVNYLKSNNIGTFRYEEALCIVLNQHSDIYSNPDNIVRILDALVMVKGVQSVNALIKILKNRNITRLKSEKDYVLSKTMQAIARVSVLTEPQKQEVNDYIQLHGLRDMIDDPAYSGNYLRFSYLHYNNEKFFQSLTGVLLLAQVHINETKNIKLGQRYLNILMDKINELYYRSIADFYSQSVYWFVEWRSVLKDNNLFNELISMMAVSLHKKKELGAFTIISPLFNRQENYALLLQFLTNLHAQQTAVTDHEVLIKSLAFMYSNGEKIIADLEPLLMQYTHQMKKHYRSIPFEINFVLAEEGYRSSIHHRVIELFDEVLNTPTLDVQIFDAETIRTYLGKERPQQNESSILAGKLMIALEAAEVDSDL